MMGDVDVMLKFLKGVLIYDFWTFNTVYGQPLFS